MSDFEYDYVVIGSGFGGSVAALRLAEKGYRVAVLERGKRWRPEDFPVTNWNIRKYLWAPRLLCHGIQAITMLRNVLVLHGSGVGGGSLVYAATLMEPPAHVFDDPAWARLGIRHADLAPHYATARRMLGAATAKLFGETDHMLHEIAHDLGRAETYQPTDVGIYFGEPGRTVADPLLGGQGPERAGCIGCGGCMVGCRHNAKNTLDRNYLYLAEQLGVRIMAESNVQSIRAVAGGYKVETVCSTSFRRRPRTFRCRGVILAAGVLGSVALLLRCRQTGSLPSISEQLGRFVRTNSETLVGGTRRRGNRDYSRGIAIASGFFPDDQTQVQMVRYGAGQDFMSLLCTLLVPDRPPWPRLLQFVIEVVHRPLKFLRLLNPFGWARRSGILLVMQTAPGRFDLTWKRPWYWPFRARLIARNESEQPPVVRLPLANDLAERLATKMDGDSSAAVTEVLFNLSTTAHILGGCCMGEVVDRQGRLLGHDNFYIVDGSVIPSNLGVNPSLTITALAEWIMSQIPRKPA